MIVEVPDGSTPGARRVECDLFCRVVDHFGDAGVCWRLARQLVAEHRFAVRLFIDDLATLALLAPAVRVDRDVQCVDGVDVRGWTTAASTAPSAVAIEAFACELPAAYRARMQDATRVWINLEYLSAESWVDGCHALASPQASGLVKHFFFPGFTAATGGLIVERDLIARRDAFVADPHAHAMLFERFGLARDDDRPSALWFCYGGDAAIRSAASFASAAAATPGWRVLLCPQPDRTGLRAALAASGPGVAIHELAFVPQPDFDALLWSCDLAVVRGEDSFVRAQLAARPMLWHAYPQDEAARGAKVEAFTDRYAQDLEAPVARAWRRAQSDLSADGLSAEGWTRLFAAMSELRLHAGRWAARLAAQPDLASNLANFVVARL